MKKSLIGAVVVAMTLLPSFAAATSTPYDVLVGNTDPYVVPGTLLLVPTLSQTEGTASIVSATFDGTAMEWTVRIACASSGTGHCKGNIIS